MQRIQSESGDGNSVETICLDGVKTVRGDGGRSRQQYKCKADGCQVTPMEVNVSKRNKVSRDWFLVKELKGCTLKEDGNNIKQIHTPDIKF